MQPIRRLEAEIHFLNAQEQQMEMELLDVFTDVDTPAGSDDDDDSETPLSIPPTSPHILQLMQNMLNVSGTLLRDTRYAGLYRQEKYTKKVNKKLKAMKKNARRCDFEKIYQESSFWSHYGRIRNTYDDDGGRQHLNMLIALECHLTDPYLDETDDEETDDDDENVDEEPLAKKLRREKKSDDEKGDDDDDNVAGINANVPHPIVV